MKHFFLLVCIFFNFQSLIQAQINFTPQTLTNLCSKNRVEGDREFNGNGPIIDYAITPKMSEDKTRVFIEVSFKARESKSDWSTLEAQWTRDIFIAPSGKIIEQIKNQSGKDIFTKITGHFISKSASSSSNCDWYEHTSSKGDFSINSSNLIKDIGIIGDTPGDDISDDLNCSCDTRISFISFQGLTVKVVDLQNQAEFIITPTQLGSFCPKQKIAGDREFGGNGPKVTTQVKLQVSQDAKKIIANIDFTAKETQSDWSEVRGSWNNLTLYTAPAGMKISSLDIESNTVVAKFTASPSPADKFYKLVNNGGVQPCDCREGYIYTAKSGSIMLSPGFIQDIGIVADTGGDDISDDSNCKCDTKIEFIKFTPLKIKLSKQ